jgi:uncharacterized lipoprotein YajG
MKRIFILAAALCLGACAAQPTTAVTANQATQTDGATLAVTAQANRSTGRVYLDDHDLIHVQAPPSNRRMLVLGAHKDTK